MSTKPKNPFADTEFVRAYHIERRELEATWEVQVTTTVTTAARPDRVVVRMEALDLRAPYEGQKPLCSVTVDWPNENIISFSACLYRASVSLTRLVSDCRNDLWKATLVNQKG